MHLSCMALLLNFSNYELTTSTSEQQADNEKQNNGSHDRDEQALQVEARNSFGAEIIHNIATEEGSDNANYNVGDSSHLLVPAGEDAGNPACNRAKDDPYKNVHVYLLVKLNDAYYFITR